MTDIEFPRDIEFDQIRKGQTVRLHCEGGYTVEGPVDLVHHDNAFPHVRIGVSGKNCTVPAERITRVELLAEPAPTWKVGQLAEIDWSSSGCAGATRKWLARWDGSAWWVLGEGALIYPSECGEPCLMTAVPADGRIVAQDAVVLPPFDGTGMPWNADALRERARRAEIAGQASAAANLRTVANAIEAQS